MRIKIGFVIRNVFVAPVVLMQEPERINNNKPVGVNASAGMVMNTWNENGILE